MGFEEFNNRKIEKKIALKSGTNRDNFQRKIYVTNCLQKKAE